MYQFLQIKNDNLRNKPDMKTEIQKPIAILKNTKIIIKETGVCLGNRKLTANCFPGKQLSVEIPRDYCINCICGYRFYQQLIGGFGQDYCM